MKTDVELAEAAGFERLINGRISHMAIEKGDCDQEVKALIRLMREELAAAVAAERERIKARLLGMDDAAAGRHNYYAHAAWVLFDRKA